MTNRWDVVVVGAGICGSRIARTCFESGLKVCVVEKSRGVGGRMATRYHESLRFDHGAQFFTVNDSSFREYVDSLVGSSLRVWWNESGRVVYRGAEGMNQLSKSLLSGIPVETSATVVDVESQPEGWRVQVADGRSWDCRYLALTAPTPQSLKLLDRCSDNPILQELSTVTYQRCVAVLIVSEKGISLGDYGIARLPQFGIATVTDNAVKGICAYKGSVLTVHFDSENSERLWEVSDEEVMKDTLLRLREAYEISPTFFNVHRWRYSEPRTFLTGRYREVCSGGSYCQIGGDFFQEAKVESAYLSGLAVGARIVELNG